MALYTYRPVANGLRTDHPIPDLPFVDDRHIPLDDPAAIEAVGRHKGSGMWGRHDPCARDGGWVAFTTDPLNRKLAWIVRWHPEHGRSVVVYRDDDVSFIHTILMWEEPKALLFRVGGYWWDGERWYRPSQVWDLAAEVFYRRPVPAAVTVTAGDLLQAGGDPRAADLMSVTEVGDDDMTGEDWRDHLALWASHRKDGSLADSVVTLAAPELTSDQFVTLAEMAQIAGIDAPTLRAYISADEEQGDVPLAQASVNGQQAWARPVAEEWAEQRRRSADGLIGAMSAERNGASTPVGTAEVWAKFSSSFFAQLWESSTGRKRWAPQWRNESAIRDLAEALSWDVAASITKIVPVHDLAATIRQAFLHEFATGKSLEPGVTNPENAQWQFVGVLHTVARTLGWLVRHDPATAGHTIQQIIGEAERELDIPRQVAEQSIRTALSLDGGLDEALLNDFLQRVVTPEADRPS